MTFLYGDPPRHQPAWATTLQGHVKKIKVNPLDDTESDFIDLDIVMKYYLDEYRTLRRDNQRRINKLFGEMLRTNEREEKPVCMRDVKELMN